MLPHGVVERKVEPLKNLEIVRLMKLSKPSCLGRYGYLNDKESVYSIVDVYPFCFSWRRDQLDGGDVATVAERSSARVGAFQLFLGPWPLGVFRLAFALRRPNVIPPPATHDHHKASLRPFLFLFFHASHQLHHPHPVLFSF